MSDSDSGDDEDVATRVGIMMKPVEKRQKKMQKRIDVLEEMIRKLSDKTEAEARSLQKAAEAGTAANAERCSRLDEQQAALAPKSMVELVRQEVSKLERAQAVLAEESRSKAYAQDMLLQGLESRIEATERAQRAADAKFSGELASLSGRVQQMNATVERMRADFEARLSEVLSTASTQHGALVSQLNAETERREYLSSVAATQAQVGELERKIASRSQDLSKEVTLLSEKYQMVNATMVALQSAQATFARVEDLDKIKLRSEEIADELNAHAQRSRAEGGASSSLEERLEAKTRMLERAAAETKRDWHNVAAKIEDLQRQIAERTLAAEFSVLQENVEKLTSASATKAETDQLRKTLSLAATAAALDQVSIQLKSLQADTQEMDGRLNETRQISADVKDLRALSEQLAAVRIELEGKQSARQAEHELSKKMDAVIGEELEARLQVADQRLQTLSERANKIEMNISEARSEVGAAGARLRQAAAEVGSLKDAAKKQAEEEKLLSSQQLELVRAVRALVLDAEMRCALDEREMEYLWAAPTQIYGSHGWRPNNGTLSERTPYPAGNFKMAVRHGGEANAKDVLARRKLLLGSIALGQKQALAAETEAATAGSADCVPIRLPSLDEAHRRHVSSALLEPAHALLAANNAPNPTSGSSLPPFTTSAASTEILDISMKSVPGYLGFGHAEGISQPNTARSLPSEGSPVRIQLRKSPKKGQAGTTASGVRERVSGS